MSVSPVPSTINIGGKTVPYTPPTTSVGPDGNWISTPAPGMADLAKVASSQATNQMNGDMFMKLLVAQLKYQDPSKPMDTGAMMQQTASLSMVEKINEMATSVDDMVKATQSLADTQKAVGTSYATMLMEQRMSSAVGLVGRTVTYADKTNPDTKVEGVVDSVRFDTEGPILSVGGKDVPLASVSSVKNPTGSATSSSSSTGAGSGSAASA